MNVSNLDHHHLGTAYSRAGDRVISENTFGTWKESFLADARTVRGLWGPLDPQLVRSHLGTTPHVPLQGPQG